MSTGLVLNTIGYYGGWVLTLTIGLGALWRGGFAERIGMATLCLCMVFGRWFEHDLDWEGLQVGVLMGDIVMLAVLVWLSWRSARRYWPIYAAGFQLLNLGTHIAELMDGGVRGWSYATAQVIFTWMIMGAIGWGVLEENRDRRQPARSAIPA